MGAGEKGTVSMGKVRDRRAIDQRVVLNGTWEQFKLIEKASADSPRVKLSFFAGTIEILTPGFQHENFSEIVGYVVLGGWNVATLSFARRRVY
jgi:hypothetical protein